MTATCCLVLTREIRLSPARIHVRSSHVNSATRKQCGIPRMGSRQDILPGAATPVAAESAFGGQFRMASVGVAERQLSPRHGG